MCWLRGFSEFDRRNQHCADRALPRRRRARSTSQLTALPGNRRRPDSAPADRQTGGDSSTQRRDVGAPRWPNGRWLLRLRYRKVASALSNRRATRICSPANRSTSHATMSSLWETSSYIPTWTDAAGPVRRQGGNTLSRDDSFELRSVRRHRLGRTRERVGRERSALAAGSRYRSARGYGLVRRQPLKQRIDMGRWITANTFKVGIQFEMILIRGVLHHAGKLRNSDPVFRYLMHEITDECNHIQMFQEFINRNDQDVPGMRRMSRIIGPIVGFISGYLSIMLFIGVLCGEQPVHYQQTLLLRRGPQIPPLLNKITYIHVAEEARHITFADDHLAEHIQHSGRLKRVAYAILFPLFLRWLMGEIVTPPRSFARQFGVPRRTFKSAYWRSGHSRRMMAESAADARRVADQLGLRTVWSRWIWRVLGHRWPRPALPRRAESAVRRLNCRAACRDSNDCVEAHCGGGDHGERRSGGDAGRLADHRGRRGRGECVGDLPRASGTSWRRRGEPAVRMAEAARLGGGVRDHDSRRRVDRARSWWCS